jgi:FAD/FMN-containing dehydrogenase
MAMTKMAARPRLAAMRDLRAAMRGTVVGHGDDAYARARQIWNGAVDHHPALFAFCETPEDVQAAVRVARMHSLPLSVRGGGHDWAGRALRHDGLVIDLSAMRRVDVDPHAHIATVEGGATAGDVIAAAAPHGLVAVTGSIGAVGMAGLTLAGGYGPLNPRYGLALDNLLDAELVLADGQRITADEFAHPDLYWALCGGGGNFGVVTAMRVRLHGHRTLLAGLIVFPWSEARSVLSRYAEAVASAPDELDVTAGILSGPDGNPVLFLAPTWSGERAQGEEILGELQRFGTPLAVQIGPMTCADMLRLFDAHVVNSRHYAVQTRWLPKLTPDTIAPLIAAGGTRTSPLSAIVLHHFHGMATRVPLRATAFGVRREHFLAEIIAAWEPGAADDGRIHRRWAQRLSHILAPYALFGGYPNLLGPDEHNQIAQAYGSNLARLQIVKRRFDPDGIFSATPLPA